MILFFLLHLLSIQASQEIRTNITIQGKYNTMMGIGIRNALYNILPDTNLNIEYLKTNDLPHWSFKTKFSVGIFPDLLSAHQYLTFLNADYMYVHTGLPILTISNSIIERSEAPSNVTVTPLNTVFLKVYLDSIDAKAVRDTFNIITNNIGFIFRYFQSLTPINISYSSEILDQSSFIFYYEVGPFQDTDSANTFMDSVSAYGISTFQYYMMSFPNDFNVTNVESCVY